MKYLRLSVMLATSCPEGSVLFVVIADINEAYYECRCWYITTTGIDIS